MNKEEKEIMELLVKAHNKYVDLEKEHPSEINEWVDSFHKLQHLIGARVLRRDYPEDWK